MTHNGTVFYYITNLQGDVVGLRNAEGTVAATYTYDAWGNLIGSSGNQVLLSLNPLRYRGYVYDEETGLYYLQSRYYNPYTGRFINGDTTDILTASPMGLTDKNLFAYCDNNPVMRIDITGHFWKEIWDWTVDIYERNMAIQQQQQELDTQILQEQINMMRDAAQATWDAYQRGYELEQEAIRLQAEANIDMFDSPADIELSLDVIDATLSFSVAAYNVGILITSTNPPAGAICIAVGALIWCGRGIYRLIQ